MKDYEMLYMQMKVDFYKDCLGHLRFYQLFVLPDVITKIQEVQIAKRKLSNMRKKKDNGRKTPRSTEEVL